MKRFCRMAVGIPTTILPNCFFDEKVIFGTGGTARCFCSSMQQG